MAWGDLGQGSTTKSSGTTSTVRGGGWGTLGETSKKKKSGGVLGAVGTVVSPIAEMVNAPQQALYHGITGIKDLAGGNAKGALGELGNTVKEAARVTPIGSLMSATEKIHPNRLTSPTRNIDFTELTGAKKLPFGLETGGKIATDPLTYLTLGLGAPARAGIEALEVAGEQALADTVRAGGLKAMSQAEKATVRQTLLDNAADVSAKKATKIVDSQMKAMATRGGGGIGARIPGTNIGGHIAGSFDPMEGLGKLGTKFPRAAAAIRPGNEEAFNVGKSEAAQQLDKASNKVFNTIRSQMLAFPGTVANRMRRGITMNLLDDIGPIKQIKRGKEFLKLQKAGHAIETTLGLDPGEVDVAIHDAMVKSEKSFAKAQKARTTAGVPLQGVRNMPGQAGLFPTAPMSYKDALEQVLAKKNLSLQAYESAMAQGGVDPQKYLGLREIMATSGHNLYSPGATGAQSLVVGGGRVAGAAHAVGNVGKKYYTGPIKHAGTAVENLNRGISALENLDRFGNVGQAAKHVEKIVGNPWSLSAAEQKVRFVSPFVGSIRSHATGVAQAALNNPAPFAALHHTLGEGILSSGSGNPVESAMNVGDAPLNLLQGNLKEGLIETGRMTGGPTAGLLRLMNNANAMPDDKSDQLKKIATELSPALSRIPFKGRKGSLLEQVERFIAGTSTASSGTTTKKKAAGSSSSWGNLTK